MTGRSKIGDGLVLPRGTAAAELQRAHAELARALAPHTQQHASKVLALKALAHALLYQAQRARLPTAELMGFMRSAVAAYTPHGERLAMTPEVRARLEKGAGLPVWPPEAERLGINKMLEVIYKHTHGKRIGVALAVCWDMLMRNAEPMGMTHEALIMRMEVLDRFQRAEGAPSQYIGAEPPSWAAKR